MNHRITPNLQGNFLIALLNWNDHTAAAVTNGTNLMDGIEIFGDGLLSSDRCLFLQDHSAVVIADLHIGYESALEADGIHIPRIQTEGILDSLSEILERYEPEKVIVLGDMKHEFSRNLGQEMKDVRSVLELLDAHAEVILVKGNHDNYLENIASRLSIDVLDKYTLGGVTFVHGHQPCGSRPLVMGHEHPSIKIGDSIGGFIKMPCFVHLQEEKILILPAFSPLASGTDVAGVIPAEYLSPIMRDVSIHDAVIYACSDIGILPLGRLAMLEGLKL
jgi:uncharacterized protein